MILLDATGGAILDILAALVAAVMIFSRAMAGWVAGTTASSCALDASAVACGGAHVV